MTFEQPYDKVSEVGRPGLMVPRCLKYSEFPEFADTERRRRGSLS